MLQADTIVVTCGLANFEQSSWSTHRRHEFWGAHEELHTKEALSRRRPAELLHEKAAVFLPAYFERASWSMQRCHKFWRLHDELVTEADYGKFLNSFEDHYPGVCDGRSVWMIECRKV